MIAMRPTRTRPAMCSSTIRSTSPTETGPRTSASGSKRRTSSESRVGPTYTMSVCAVAFDTDPALDARDFELDSRVFALDARVFALDARVFALDARVFALG